MLFKMLIESQAKMQFSSNKYDKQEEKQAQFFESKRQATKTR